MEWAGEWIGVNPGDCNGELAGGAIIAGETAKGSSSSKYDEGDSRPPGAGPEDGGEYCSGIGGIRVALETNLGVVKVLSLPEYV